MSGWWWALWVPLLAAGALLATNLGALMIVANQGVKPLTPSQTFKRLDALEARYWPALHDLDKVVFAIQEGCCTKNVYGSAGHYRQINDYFFTPCRDKGCPLHGDRYSIRLLERLSG